MQLLDEHQTRNILDFFFALFSGNADDLMREFVVTCNSRKRGVHLHKYSIHLIRLLLRPAACLNGKGKAAKDIIRSKKM